jgi:hypothetical protein
MGGETMLRSFDFAEYLATLNVDEADMLGILGRGYPTSFYRVYVRRPGDRWIRVEHEARPYRTDPVLEHARMMPRDRTCVVWGRLAYLGLYSVASWKPSLVSLHARALAPSTGRRPWHLTMMAGSPPETPRICLESPAEPEELAECVRTAAEAPMRP